MIVGFPQGEPVRVIPKDVIQDLADSHAAASVSNAGLSLQCVGDRLHRESPSAAIAAASGDGHAELLDAGSTEITYADHNGDEAILKVKRDTSSTAS